MGKPANDIVTVPLTVTADVPSTPPLDALIVVVPSLSEAVKRPVPSIVPNEGSSTDHGKLPG
jgi:hypothetical protein